MNKKKLTSLNIAICNIRHKSTRSIALISLVAILSFVLFSSSILSISLKNGLECMKNRLGADFILVPAENQNDMESILLQGKPSTFYFDSEIEQQIASIDGVKSVSSQFFLQTLNASCCSFPVQLIGFNPDTDFSVKSWISQIHDQELKTGELIVGSDITIDETRTIDIFGKSYKIVGVLEKTGTGYDQTIYVTMDTIENMYKDAISKGVTFEGNINPKSSVSSILIRLEDERKKDEVITAIYDKFTNVNVVEPQSIISTISNNFSNISIFLNIFSILFFILAFLTLFIVFSISANERKKEFAIFRILGSTKMKLKSILLQEACLIGICGGIIGIIIASIVVFPFSIYIEDQLGLPYIQPSIFEILKFVIIDLIISIFVGPLASVYSIHKINKAETYITMKESD